jgi:hypothetical protein
MTISTRIGRLDRAGCYSTYASDELSNAHRAADYFRSSLELPTEDRHFWDPGHTRGHLDEDSLWQIAGGVPRPRCFRQSETVQIPSVFLGLLVDCSGSMTSGRRMSRARTLALAFARSLEGHPKCHVSVAGHTERNGKVILYLVKHPMQPLNEDAFGSLTCQSGNLDAYALQAYGRMISKQMGDHDTGMIGLICDGEPCHSARAMTEAMEQVRHDYRLHTIGIGIGGDMNHDHCRRLYGSDDNYIIASDPMDSLPQLATKINTFIGKLAPV